MSVHIGTVTVPIISREVDALAEHFKNYTAGPGFDVLRLVEGYRHYVAEVDAKIQEIARLQELAYVSTRRKEEVEGRGIALQAAIELANHERFKAEAEVKQLREENQALASSARRAERERDEARARILRLETVISQYNAMVAMNLTPDPRVSRDHFRAALETK